MSTAAIPAIGYMPMPANFPYRSLFLHGRPRHLKYDDFWRKHPPMDHVHRAKIFSAFDALAGFDEAVKSKEEIYECRRKLSDGEKEELDRRLAVLQNLTYNSKTARVNKPIVTIQYFSPCTDIHNDWYGIGGQYVTVTGTVKQVDGINHMVTVDDMEISLEDVVKITGPAVDSILQESC